MDVDERWRRLETWLEANASPYASGLHPPATPAERDAAEDELAVTLPPSVRQTYLTHDGEDGSMWGALGHPMLTLSALVEKTETMRGIDGDFDYDYWDESLVPVCHVGNGDYLCVSDAPDGEETPFRRNR